MPEPTPSSEREPSSADHAVSEPQAERHHENVLRDALTRAGTSVWEWNLASDHIDGLDDGAALLGYAPGTIEPTQQAWNQFIHPEDLADNESAYLTHARGDTPFYESEYRARASDGTWQWVSERGQILDWTPDHAPRRMVGTLSHIDRRKRVETAAVELLDRLQQIARSAPGVLFQYRRTGASGAYLYVSDRSSELLGLSPQQLTQDHEALHRLMLAEDAEQLGRESSESFQTLEPWRTEYRVRHPARGLRWLRITSTARREGDDSTLWHGYIEDITESRQLDEARKDAAAARAANSAKTEFLARMSHELRTPLNAVLGFSQLMEMDTREPLTAEQRRRVGFVREAGTHLLQMIGEMLDLTRIESGQMVLDPQPMLPALLLRECMQMLRPQADAAGVQMRLLDDDMQLRITADNTRLRQVCINLISNAIKYNRRGGSVQLRLVANASDVSIQVADTGAGIREADLGGLFEPFNRLQQANSGIEGTGIGLAVTKRLVDLMGGRIEVQSQAGTGSTFIVVVPRVAPGASGTQTSLS